MRSGDRWVVIVGCVVVAVSTVDGKELPQQDGRIKYAYREVPTEEEINYRHARDQDDHSSGAFNPHIARPVSYSIFSSNLHGPAGVRVEFKQPFHMQPSFLDKQLPLIREEDTEKSDVSTEADQQQTYLPNGVLYQSKHEERNPPAMRRTVQFPLNTVLPGNSLGFDHQPYPGLLQAVNTFSDLTPSRKPQAGVLVTHNTVSLPSTDRGVTTTSKTRIFHRPGYGEAAKYPIREFTETTHNTKGDKGSVLERTQHLRVHEGLDGDPAESFALFKTGPKGNQFAIENGQANVDFRGTSKGAKGEKSYKKESEHHKTAKGHHDKEQDIGNTGENSEKETKYHKDEDFYGEHLKKEKGGKEKKYGEGGKHKKGHTTHGEHNVVKKDEFIKNTKFYDEDHGSGEHEEHGEFYGHLEEKKGGNKDGKHKIDEYHKMIIDNKKHHDRGHDDEIGNGHETKSGREQHYEHEEEYGTNKESDTSKKWGSSISDKY